MNDKICVVTSSRADYGLLKPLLIKLEKSRKCRLQILITGSHLIKKYGYTINEIIHDQYNKIHKLKFNMSSDTYLNTNNSIGIMIKKSSIMLSGIKPKLLVVMGDRFEIFAIVVASYVLNIPVVHISGGETTEGALDEGFRHSITKMSFLHFTSTNIYKKRVIQLGENPDSVFNIGEIGLDNLKNINYLTKNNLVDKFNFKFDKYNFLITLHPVTLEKESSQKNIMNLLKALSAQKETNFFFTLSNADPDNNIIDSKIKSYVKRNKNRSFYFKSLGRENYLSLLKFVDCVIGNSSSGIIEAPSFKTYTIDIGDRQKGRVKSKSVINVNSNVKEIIKAINKVKSNKKNHTIFHNPYFKKNSVDKCYKVLIKYLYKNINLKKKFYDL